MHLLVLIPVRFWKQLAYRRGPKQGCGASDENDLRSSQPKKMDSLTQRLQGLC